MIMTDVRKLTAYDIVKELQVLLNEAEDRICAAYFNEDFQRGHELIEEIERRTNAAEQTSRTDSQKSEQRDVRR